MQGRRAWIMSILLFGLGCITGFFAGLQPSKVVVLPRPVLVRQTNYTPTSGPSTIPPPTTSSPTPASTWSLPTRRCRGSQNCNDPLRDGTPQFKKLLEEYVTRHTAVMTRPVSSPLDANEGFVVFESTNDGLGNKMLPLISTFALALLMNRTFLVDWPAKFKSNPGHVSDFLDPPIPGVGWELDGLYQRYPYLRGDNTTRTLDLRTPDATPQQVDLFCKDPVQYLKQHRIIIIPSDQYFLPLLVYNERYRHQFEEWFELGNIFGPLARFIARPQPGIAKFVDDFRKQHFADYNIGIQIRATESFQTDGERISGFFTCGRKLAALYGRNEKNVSFVMATDSPQLREQARSILGDQFHSFDHEVTRETVQGVQAALREMLILASCDDIITTPSSTFGYFSHGYSSLVPYRIPKNGPVRCYKMTSSEPHPHLWRPMFRYKEEKNPCRDEPDVPAMMYTDEARDS